MQIFLQPGPVMRPLLIRDGQCYSPAMIYADHNATSPLRPEARAAMLAALDLGANPSSVHGPGRAARKTVEAARSAVAAALGARDQDVVFTGGGTEASALALVGAVAALKGHCTVLVSAIEHEAVARNAAATGVPVLPVGVRDDGVIDLAALQQILSAWDLDRQGVPLLALMLANNETGVIQPVAAAAGRVRDAGGLIHCDAVQGLGKIPVNVGLLQVDYLAVSSHKIGGPQGVGALWVRSGAPLLPVVRGGGQERSLRSGTENVAGLAGFGAAVRAALRDMPDMTRLRALRDALEARLQASAGIVVFGQAADRLPQTTNFALPGVRSESQMMALDLDGVAVSSGAACSSGKVARSTVLDAMRVDPDLAACAIRVSFGWNSADSDADQVAEAWQRIVSRILA